ncbi:hypothetical protein P153DRAFT_413440, partial [Dothidotthia symphoricarpi CBS 119687]
TTGSLSDHNNETSGDELPTDSTVAGIRLQRTSHNQPPAGFLLHREKPSTLPDWPSSPKPINTPIYVKALNGLFDVLLFACSAAFLAFAIVVKLHDRVPTAEYPRLTTTLLRATKYGPTVFPILFASIIGRAAHAILLWRLEKGERVGLLDTLASSTSLTSTVISQLQLRSLSILGVALLVVWSLSPIGGQASVRVMSIGTKDAQIHESLSYMVNSGNLGAYTPADMFIQGLSYSSVVFVAALMGSPATKSSPLDVWGNVKMPRIEDYEGSALMDDDGWYDVNGGDSDAYSSLIGIPIVGIHESNFIDYVTRVQSPLLSLQCSVNTTALYIEAEVRCPTPLTCTLRRVRRSRLNHFLPAWTLLDKSWRTPNLLFQGMLNSFNGKLYYLQLFNCYLLDLNLVNLNYANVSQITKDKYAIRLG